MVAPKMVFASRKELPIGKVLNPGDFNFVGYYFDDGNMHEAQPFFIKRLATKEEWVQSCIDMFGKYNHPEDTFPYFYEVSTD